MHDRHRRTAITAILLLASLGLAIHGCDNGLELPERLELEPTGYQPDTLHLTWCQDPTRSIRIQWLHEPENADTPTSPRIAYRRIGTTTWQSETGHSKPFPVVEAVTHAHYGDHPDLYQVDLAGLTPDTTYEFVIQPHDTRYHFRTAPATLDAPLTFAVGGDVDVSDAALKTSSQVAARDPLFAALGGDLAYEDGADTDRFILWLQQWSEHMRTEEARFIPMIAAVGNHEATEPWHDPDKTYAEMKQRAPFFIATFGCLYEHQSYATLDFGDYMSLILLDTDHLSPLRGKQSEWLGQQLAERHARPFVFPVYHVPAWPSARDFDYRRSRYVRSSWVPRFEEHNLRVVFEHHDHTYKRTPPIRDGEINAENGVIYIGDGAWGRRLRTPHDPDETWYLDVAKERHHANLITIHTDRRIKIVSVTSDGETIDTIAVD
jgi:hypothetical protein